MLGQQFYHETMRKVIISFGTLFNNINLVRKNNTGAIVQTMKVPLAYGPKQKWLSRLDADASLNTKVAITLPRLGFEIQNLSYDPARKLNRVQKFKKVKSSSDDSNKLDSQFMPVPYNLDMELYAMAKNSDDALQIVEQIVGGYTTQDIAGGAGTTTLSVSDGSTGATLSHRMIEFTGSITGNRIVTIPLDVQTFYYLRNSTSGAYTVEFKYVTGSGDSFTFGATDKGDAVVFATANDGTNPDIDTLPNGNVTTGGTQTLTNKTLTSPKIGTSILDTNGNELALLTATGSAVNEITLANGATGDDPTITASGGDANVGIEFKTKGTGVIKAEDGGGTVAAVKIAGKETIWVPASAMYPATSNGCADLAQVELTAQRPEVKSLDFDASSDEYAQFGVAFPKSWNEGTVTFQTYWSVGGTNTGTVCFALQGVAVSSDDTLDVAMGTAVPNTALAASGTANDLMVNAESGAVTIGGSPAAGDECFFNIFRDVSADDQTSDARLVGLKLFYTTDAANDV